MIILAVVQYGIYFYDNPGLCYTPFTLKWDEMIESLELQTIDLYALHSNENITLWYEYCQCKYLNLCHNHNQTNINLSLINIQSNYIYNELLRDINEGSEKRNLKKRNIIDSINQSSEYNSSYIFVISYYLYNISYSYIYYIFFVVVVFVAKAISYM